MGNPEKTVGAFKYASAVHTVLELYELYTSEKLGKNRTIMLQKIDHIPNQIIQAALSNYIDKCKASKAKNQKIPHPNYFIAVCAGKYSDLERDDQYESSDLTDVPPLTIGKLV